MNIEIASVCNLKCPYCFAGDHMQAMKIQQGDSFISPDIFEQRLDFLERSGMNEVRLIGGEPTLHPQFPQLLQRAKERQKLVMVFSHGLMPERAIAALETLSPDDCTVLINMNAMTKSAGPSTQEQERRMRTIVRLGPRILLGYNIYKTNFDLRFLIPIILEANCRKAIRVGLAHPTVDGDNDYLHPKEYPFVGAKLIEFCQIAAAEGITLDFDCGFVRCMFSDEDIALLQQTNANYGWRCSPIVDVDLQGQAFHCFPLSEHIQVPLHAVANTAELRQQLGQQVELYRVTGIYRECTSCLYKIQGECAGGGIEHIMRRFRHTAFSIAIPATPLYQSAAPEDASQI